VILVRPASNSRLHGNISAVRRYALILLPLILGVPASSAAQPDARQVLLLNSFERGSTENLFAGMLRTELGRKLSEPINFFEVSLQPALSPENPREGPAVDYLQHTFAGQRLDLVVTLGGPAAGFAEKYGGRLFPTTPVLLAAMDQVWVQDRTLSANETAIAAITDPVQLIQGIRQVLPATTTVFVVIGASRVEKFWRDELQKAFRPFEDRVTFLWSDDLSFADTLKRASALPQHSAILYVLFSMDANGVSQAEERTLSELRAVANAPLFGLYDIQLGDGVVGGSLLPVEDLVRSTADVALRVLRGESPSAIVTAPQHHGRPMYDWRELQRWGISEALLPAGSTVLFRQPGIWDQYKSYIVAAAAILALQSALIAGLVVQRARRRRTEHALRESEQRFRATAEQNQDLAGRLINAQEEERTRIARDLHDDLSQQLAGVGIILSGLRRRIGKLISEPEIDETVTSLQERTSALAQSVRTLSHELHPSVLEHAGLVATVRRQCADVEEHHHVEVIFSAGDNLDSLRPEIALCLFRVAQEALTNAVRHARARTIRVGLTATDDDVELRVDDDGIGFVAGARTGSGLGLRSIDERVRLAKGRVILDSRPGHGTTLRVRIPLAAGLSISPAATV
jgi:signal transduction histidine kinase